MSLAVAQVSAPRMPPTFFVVDVRNRKLVNSLASRPDLKPEDLATVEPIEFTARDGLKIRAYLTTPNGPQTKQLPMIVLVHGGPHGVYDTYDFDFEPQLFASRGYVVLQVNYRGSGGRGSKFQGAGTASGAAKCRTTLPTPCVGRSAMASRTQSGSASTAAATTPTQR